MASLDPTFHQETANIHREHEELECHLRSRISTTSDLEVPRRITIRLPSRDKSKPSIHSLLKWVICFGVPPAIGWLQILPTRPSSLTYRSERLSAAHRN